MKNVTFNNGTSLETVLGTVTKLGDLTRLVLTRADNGQEIDLHHSDIVSIKNFDKDAVRIGVITYKKYDERVLLNESFNVDDLINIILNEPSFKSFSIEGSDFKFERHQILEVYKDEKILSDYMFMGEHTYKKKITWYASNLGWGIGIKCKTKKDALEVVKIGNDKSIKRIKNTISKYISK